MVVEKLYYGSLKCLLNLNAGLLEKRQQRVIRLLSQFPLLLDFTLQLLVDLLEHALNLPVGLLPPLLLSLQIGIELIQLLLNPLRNPRGILLPLLLLPLNRSLEIGQPLPYPRGDVLNRLPLLSSDTLHRTAHLQQLLIRFSHPVLRILGPIALLSLQLFVNGLLNARDLLAGSLVNLLLLQADLA